MYNNGVRLKNIQTIDHDISIIQYVIPLTLRTIRTQIKSIGNTAKKFTH